MAGKKWQQDHWKLVILSAAGSRRVNTGALMVSGVFSS